MKAGTRQATARRLRREPSGAEAAPRAAGGRPRRSLQGPESARPRLFEAPIRRETLEELAYRHLRQALVEGRLAPGERIVAGAVAQAAGISRIPVLQALRRLESEGFVRINPHRDVVVAGLSPEEFRERFLLMASLEALCLREAAGRITAPLITGLRRLQRDMIAARAAGNTARAVAADSDFHRRLWEASGLRQVIQLLQNVWDRGEYYRVIMHARRGGFAGSDWPRPREAGERPHGRPARKTRRTRWQTRVRDRAGGRS
jgi:DNA-binding GntR family transcriptional regulator